MKTSVLYIVVGDTKYPKKALSSTEMVSGRNSVCVSAGISVPPARQISAKFDSGGIYETLTRKSDFFFLNRAKKSDTLHASLSMFYFCRWHSVITTALSSRVMTSDPCDNRRGTHITRNRHIVTLYVRCLWCLFSFLLKISHTYHVSCFLLIYLLHGVAGVAQSI